MVINSRFFKGSIIGVLLVAVLLVTPGMANAMQFSEPMKIGEVGWKKNIFAKQALPSSVEGAYYDFRGANNVVRFDVRSQGRPRIGSANDSNNVVEMRGFANGNFIYEITGDNGLSVYVIVLYGSDSESVIVLGPNRQGRYAKYIDHEGFEKANGGQLNSMQSLNSPKLSVQNDTIIINGRL